VDIWLFTRTTDTGLCLLYICRRGWCVLHLTTFSFLLNAHDQQQKTFPFALETENSKCLLTQNSLGSALVFDNILTQHKIRVEKKLKSEVAPYKCNHSMNFWLQTVLEPVLDGLLVDNNLKYTKKSLTCTPGSSSFLLDA